MMHTRQVMVFIACLQVFTGFSANRSEITAMCYACYHVWMGTSSGELRVVDIVTHEARFVHTLEPSLARRRGDTLSSVVEEETVAMVCSRAICVRAVVQFAGGDTMNGTSIILQCPCFKHAPLQSTLSALHSTPVVCIG